MKQFEELLMVSASSSLVSRIISNRNQNELERKTDTTVLYCDQHGLKRIDIYRKSYAKKWWYTRDGYEFENGNRMPVKKDLSKKYQNSPLPPNNANMRYINGIEIYSKYPLTSAEEDLLTKSIPTGTPHF